jgi:hypothetical protein
VPKLLLALAKMWLPTALLLLALLLVLVLL